MQRVQISDLSFSYKGSDKLILKDINMNVEAGEFVCILGQSGCGKKYSASSVGRFGKLYDR